MKNIYGTIWSMARLRDQMIMDLSIIREAYEPGTTNQYEYIIIEGHEHALPTHILEWAWHRGTSPRPHLEILDDIHSLEQAAR